MRRDPQAVLLALILTLVPALAAAQVSGASGAPRVWVGVNGGVQTGDNSVAQSFSVQKNLEDAPIRVNADEKSGTLFDAGVVVRLIGHFGMGFSLSVVTHDTDATVSASIPHPFFFNRLRDIQGTTSFSRRETGAHIQAVYLVPGRRFDFMVYGGPTLFTLRQTLVTDVTYSESFPFDTATFTAAQTAESTSKTETGFHLGGDFAWKFTRNVGVGAMIRYAHAQATLNATNNPAITVDVGGTQIGGGVRLAF